jgi:hypothetical protein
MQPVLRPMPLQTEALASSIARDSLLIHRRPLRCLCWTKDRASNQDPVFPFRILQAMLAFLLSAPTYSGSP